MTGTVRAEELLREGCSFRVHSVYRHTVNITAGEALLAIHPEETALTPLSLAVPFDGQTFDRFAEAARQDGSVFLKLIPAERFGSHRTACGECRTGFQVLACTGGQIWPAGTWKSWDPVPDIRLQQTQLSVLERLTAEFLREHGTEKGGFKAAAAMTPADLPERPDDPDRSANRLKDPAEQPGTLMEKALLRHVQEILSCSLSDCEKIFSQAVALLGLGSGLTPSGDDFLVGLMLALHAVRLQNADELQQKLAAVLKREAYRTNDISREYLFCACRGEYGYRLHELLRACEELPAQTAEKKTRKALEAAAAVGHSSGVDTLNGLLTGIRLIRKEYAEASPKNEEETDL